MLRNSIADVEERHGRLELTLNMKITDKVKWSVLFFMLDIITYYEFFSVSINFQFRRSFFIEFRRWFKPTVKEKTKFLVLYEGWVRVT